MIVSFGDRETERLYHSRANPPRMPPAIMNAVLRKLDLLDNAADLVDLGSPPGNRLEALRGNRAGFHSIRANDQWRVIFRWAARNADDVRVLDHHS